HRHLAAHLGCGAHRVQGGRLECLVVVLRNHQYSHRSSPENIASPPRHRRGPPGQMTLASFFSLSTRAPTSGTLTPACRPGGSLTFSVFRRGAGSTPKSAGLNLSSCFFF